MNTKGCVALLFLSFLTLFTLTNCSTCDKNILEGESLIFKLTDRPLKDDDRFSIKKVDKYIVPKRNKNQQGPGTLKDMSLEFQHVDLKYSGTYTVEVFDGNGVNIKSYSEHVCVYVKIPKPKVTVTCQNDKVDVRCDVTLEADKDQRSNISYIWHKNGKEFKTNVLNFSANVDSSSHKYTCTAKNPAHTSTSDPEEVRCARTLLGFDFWLMIGILAGGGFLVLLLIVVLVTCSCRACKRRVKHQRDEEEFRLNYLNTSPSGPQKSKQTARGQPAPPEPCESVLPQEEAQAPCETKPKTRNHQRARPPPPPIDDEEEPPPLPKPRKTPHVKNHEGPM